MKSPRRGLNIGVVGAGGFANFAAGHFVTVDGIEVVAVTDTNRTAASAMATEFGATAYCNLEQLLADERVDLVYVATPPHLHFQQSRMALLAGKHVICEKPAALSTRDAEELVALAKSEDKLYVVNLMQRYNPLFEVVKTIINEKWLGDFTHGFFENYASDEFLDESHWFWDESKSGGIFIEHGVHFFDLFAGWLGDGDVIFAGKWQRPGSQPTIFDRVQALVNYEKGPVSFYHGFDQPKALDRQEMRLQFEKGDITLHGWIPVRFELNGLLDNETIREIQTLLPSSKVKASDHNGIATDLGDVDVKYASLRQERLSAHGRSKRLEYDYHVSIREGHDSKKLEVYAESLVRMIKDQRGLIFDRNSKAVIDSENAVESLRTSERATHMTMIF